MKPLLKPLLASYFTLSLRFLLPILLDRKQALKSVVFSSRARSKERTAHRYMCHKARSLRKATKLTSQSFNNYRRLFARSRYYGETHRLVSMILDCARNFSYAGKFRTKMTVSLVISLVVIVSLKL